MLSIVCFFWRDAKRVRNYTFDTHHISILRNMVERNIDVDHRFVCCTNEEVEGVETIPLPDDTFVAGTVYPRLIMRKPEFAREIGDRILSLDLDVVITANLEPVISRTEPAVFWRNPNFPKPGRAFYQSSIQLFDAGTHPELYYDFDPVETPKWVNWRFGGAEQAWISEKLPWDLPFFDHRDGIYGAGRIGDWNSDRICDTLPHNAVIVSFPGNREPSQREVQDKFPWVKRHYR